MDGLGLGEVCVPQTWKDGGRTSESQINLGCAFLWEAEGSGR